MCISTMLCEEQIVMAAISMQVTQKQCDKEQHSSFVIALGARKNIT